MVGEAEQSHAAEGGRYAERRDGARRWTAFGLVRLHLHPVVSPLSPAGYSPGSIVDCGTGLSGCWPPMAIMRSMASRARLATASGTVMRCSRRSIARFTLGSVVTFM